MDLPERGRAGSRAACTVPFGMCGYSGMRKGHSPQCPLQCSGLERLPKKQHKEGARP